MLQPKKKRYGANEKPPPPPSSRKKHGRRGDSFVPPSFRAKRERRGKGVVVSYGMCCLRFYRSPDVTASSATYGVNTSFSWRLTRINVVRLDNSFRRCAPTYVQAERMPPRISSTVFF